jgi:hypothetical protein
LFFASDKVNIEDVLYLISIEAAGLIERYRISSHAKNGLNALQNALKENVLVPPEKNECLVQLTQKALVSPLDNNEGINFSVSAYCDIKNNTAVFVIPTSYENYKSVRAWNLAVFIAAVEQYYLKPLHGQ